MTESANNNYKWYVLKAMSGKEAKVKEYIEAQMNHNDLLGKHVAQVLLPMEKHVTQRGNKRVVKEKMSLPGYVFVQAALEGEIASLLRFMPNVLGFLGGTDKPIPVPQTEIDRMLGTAEESEIEEKVDIPYSVDDAVKVTDGPFSGFTGIVTEVNSEKRRLRVMVKIFGRENPVDLSFMQVEKE